MLKLFSNEEDTTGRKWMYIPSKRKLSPVIPLLEPGKRL